MSNFITVSSRDNDYIKLVVQLMKSSKKRREEGLFVLEGLRLCLDAIENNFTPEMVFITSSASEKYSGEIGSLIASSPKTFMIPESLFSKISDTVTPQGIMGVFKIPDFNIGCFNGQGRYIALENLQDPSNLGAVSRTAEALGISGIILQGGCDPYSPKSLRASMGALLRIPVFIMDDMFSFFKSREFNVYGAVVNNAKLTAGSFSFSDRSVVVIGNEANGLSESAIKNCTETVTIPMKGNSESLNAAVAASILMWEMSK